MEGCWRRRHQDIPHSLDCYGTGPERMFGEVLESWGDSQNAVFGTYMGRNTFQAILSNLQVLDSTLDLPCNNRNHDPLYKVHPMLNMMDRTFVQSYKSGRDLSFAKSCH